MNNIAVSGWGMVSSLGQGVAGSCAAARAGLRRTKQIEAYMPSSEDGEESLVNGHVAAAVADGFEGKGRLLRLLEAALADVARETWPETGAPPGGSALYLSVPDRARLFTHLHAIENEALRKERAALAEEAVLEHPHRVTEDILRVAERLLGWPPFRVAHVASSGRPGFAEALSAALRDLRMHRELTTAIVGGVDSLVDGETLAWLDDCRILKTNDNPVGLEPGEAAAFIVLQRADASPRNVLGWVSASFVQDVVPTARGAGLCDALLSARELAQQPRIDWVVSDHDGSQARADELGHALTRLTVRDPTCRPYLTYPAIAFGDVGAATGAVASCVALHGWRRRCAPAKEAFLLGVGGTQRGVHVLLDANA